MQLSRGVAHFPGGTLFITDSSGRRFSRKNQSTESSAVCVENFRERQDDLYGTCYVPHDPRVRRYGLSAFLVRPLRELDCSKCRSLQLQLEHYLNIAWTIWQDASWWCFWWSCSDSKQIHVFFVCFYFICLKWASAHLIHPRVHELWNSSFSLQMPWRCSVTPPLHRGTGCRTARHMARGSDWDQICGSLQTIDTWPENQTWSCRFPFLQGIPNISSCICFKPVEKGLWSEPTIHSLCTKTEMGWILWRLYWIILIWYWFDNIWNVLLPGLVLAVPGACSHADVAFHLMPQLLENRVCLGPSSMDSIDIRPQNFSWSPLHSCCGPKAMRMAPWNWLVAAGNFFSAPWLPICLATPFHNCMICAAKIQHTVMCCPVQC